MEDNWLRQADEVEALSSIFNDQFKIEDEINHKYSIIIKDNHENSQFTITLQVTFPPEYPSDSPPIYQINASWLRGEERQRLQTCLDEIYCDNLGESLIFLWTEKIREFLTDRFEALSSSSAKCSPALENIETVGIKEAEEDEGDCDDDDEYGFNPELHTYKPSAAQETGECGEFDGIELPPIHHGEFVKDRKSVFQGHLAPVSHQKQVDMVLNKLKENKKIAAATHNIIAYRIQCGRDSFVTGCFDDGEIHAGSRMLHLLNIVDARNVLVIVTRWYGGVHLGPDRFKHINNCTRVLLESHGYVKDKAGDKKGPKSHASGQDKQGPSQNHQGSSRKKGK